MVLTKAVLRITDCAKTPGFEILLPADVVDDLRCHRIEEQPVDREVAALGVLLGGGEVHFRRAAAIEIWPFRSERRNLDDASALANEDHTERGADGLRALEELLHALRRGVGGDVVVLRF